MALREFDVRLYRRMDRFSDMKLFLAVVEAGGLAARGRRMGLSPARVSERLQAMEAHGGVRLLTRSTRSLSPTDEGRQYAEAARSILADVDDLDARLRDGRERISGLIHLAAPFDLGRSRIAPLLDRFMAEHPRIVRWSGTSLPECPTARTKSVRPWCRCPGRFP